VAAEHARVGFRSFFQRKFFHHGSNAGKSRETQSVFGVAGSPGGPALYALAAADEGGARDFNGRHIRADNQQRTVAAQPVKISDMAVELGAVNHPRRHGLRAGAEDSYTGGPAL